MSRVCDAVAQKRFVKFGSVWPLFFSEGVKIIAVHSFRDTERTESRLSAPGALNFGAPPKRRGVNLHSRAPLHPVCVCSLQCGRQERERKL